MKKKVDARVRILVENGVKERKRTFFVLVGDRGRDQVRPRVQFCLSRPAAAT